MFTYIKLCENNIRTEGATEIAKSLLTNTSLHILDLSWNNVGPIEVAEIAKSLLTNTCLHTLDLSSNNVGSKNFVKTANMLESNYTLIYIYPEYDNIKINEIINRNKNIFENRRFMKTKKAGFNHSKNLNN